MRITSKFGQLAICWVAVFFVVFILSEPASSNDNNCYLEAEFETILVAVWNADADDNTKNEFWRGPIEVGKQQLIQCETGRIKISTKSTEPDTAMVNKGYHDCTDGNVISLMAD